MKPSIPDNVPTAGSEEKSTDLSIIFRHSSSSYHDLSEPAYFPILRLKLGVIASQKHIVEHFVQPLDLQSGFSRGAVKNGPGTPLSCKYDRNESRRCCSFVSSDNARLTKEWLAPRHPLRKHTDSSDLGKQWHAQKSAFRPKAGHTSYEKRTQERKAMAAMKAKEKEMKDEKEDERQV